MLRSAGGGTETKQVFRASGDGGRQDQPGRKHPILAVPRPTNPVVTLLVRYECGRLLGILQVDVALFKLNFEPHFFELSVVFFLLNLRRAIMH